MDQCTQGTWAHAWVSFFAVLNTAFLVFNQWDRRRSFKRIERKVDRSNERVPAKPE